METSHLLVAEALGKSFPLGKGSIEVLKSISFHVDRGEFVAVMGPSGSGKSTLLHLLAGLTGITSGRVALDGRLLNGYDDRQWTRLRRRRMGFVFQAFNLLPTMSIRNNITLPLEADGRRVDERTLTALTDRLAITPLLDRFPAGLSGGEQQRAAIARALLPEPDLILADEPTGSLDTENGQQLCAILQGFARQEGRTILMVTHEPAVAFWSDRILVMRDGRLIGELSPAGLSDGQALALAYQRLQNQPQAR